MTSMPPKGADPDDNVRPVGPPPGWYADPDSTASGQRWWDGYRWTEHRVPLQAPPPAVAQPSAGFNSRLFSGEADRAAGTNTAAIWSLVTGIGGVIVVFFAWWLGALFSIAALIWGQVGMGRARRHGVGYGLSIAGMVLGSVIALLVILRIGTFGL